MKRVCRQRVWRAHGSQRRSFSISNILWGSKSEGKDEVEAAGGLGLPTPEEAQKLPIVQIPKLLSDEEVRQIIETSLSIRRDGAGSVLLQADPWDTNDHYGTDRGDWHTTYVSFNHMFQNRLPELHQKLVQAAVEADRDKWHIIETALAAHTSEEVSLQTRCVEWHHVGTTGGLPNDRHYDSGSCVTVDVMLNEAAAGGVFETLELLPDGTEATVGHCFEKGDVIVFPSHKYHSVSPVTDVSTGHRQVCSLHPILITNPKVSKPESQGSDSRALDRRRKKVSPSLRTALWAVCRGRSCGGQVERRDRVVCRLVT